MDPGLIILVLDTTLGTDEFAGLVKRILTRRELSAHFPQLPAREAELARVSALPAGERATCLISWLATYDGLITSEDAAAALRCMDDLAIPGLLRALTSRDRTWQIAKILADIGRPGQHVTDALSAALTWARGPDQRWIACALSRLGRLDLVLARAGQLPVVTSVAAPYTGFRDHCAAPLPLDYQPLEDFLERWPAMARGPGWAAAAQHWSSGRTAPSPPAACPRMPPADGLPRHGVRAESALWPRHLGHRPGEFGGPPESVIFTFTCSPPGHQCTNWNLTFDLQAESSGPSGGPALFYYLGDPDDWNDQYAFTRQ